jgi:hypothetical protein
MTHGAANGRAVRPTTMPMPWSAHVPAVYLRCTWSGSQCRRPAPQRADAGALARLRSTPGICAASRRAETSAGVRQLEPGHQLPPAPPPPAPPRREVRDEMKPATAFGVAARRPSSGVPGPARSVTSIRTMPSPAMTATVTVSPGAPDRLCRILLLKTSLTSKIAASRQGARSRVPQRRMRGRPAPAPHARQASRSPGPPAQPSPHPSFPGRPAPGNRPGSGRTQGHARSAPPRTSSRTPASTDPRPWTRPCLRPPSVAVRAKPTVPRTAPRPRFPSAMRPWTPQHNAPQRYKVTHAGTEQKRPASTRIRS